MEIYRMSIDTARGSVAADGWKSRAGESVAGPGGKMLRDDPVGIDIERTR
jgi:hypothetical protein